MRTRKPFLRSRTGRLLWLSTLVVAVVTFANPYLPGTAIMEFTPLPLPAMLLLGSITMLYVVAVEVAKKYY